MTGERQKQACAFSVEFSSLKLIYLYFIEYMPYIFNLFEYYLL